MKRPTHMREAGVSAEREAFLARRATRAELFVRRELGGVMRDEYDPTGDVITAAGEIVDVKAIDDYAAVVNGGRKRPVVRVIVVAFDRLGTPAIVGEVPPSAWHKGFPPLPNARECHYVLRAEVRPLTAWEPEPEPAIVDDPVEGRRAEWRRRKERQRLRDANAPVPLWGPGADEPKTALRSGLIGSTRPGRGSKRKSDDEAWREYVEDRAKGPGFGS